MNKDIRPESSYSQFEELNLSQPIGRPKTPSYLYSSENESEYQKVLTNNITDYISSSERKGQEELLDSLLPKDVSYLFREQNEVKERIDKLFCEESKKVEEVFDGFLKEMIILCEEKKKEATEILQKDQKRLESFYSGFRSEVQGFLNRAENCLSKGIMARNLENEEFLNESYNPLETHMKKLKLQKEQMSQVEATIKKIHQSYQQSRIPGQKINLELMIFEQKNESKQIIHKTSLSRSLLENNLKREAVRCSESFKTLLSSAPREESYINMKSSIHQGFQRNYQMAVLEEKKPLSPQRAKSTNPLYPNSALRSVQDLPVPRPTSYENSKNAFFTLNLEHSLSKKPNTLSNKSLGPVYGEQSNISKRWTKDAQKMRSSNISININNQLQNHNNYINIYNHNQNQLGKLKTGQLSKQKPISRPSSSGVKPLEGGSARKSFRPVSSIKDNNSTSNSDLLLSVTKTNVVANDIKIPQQCDFIPMQLKCKSQVTCFDLDTTKQQLYYGTADGSLVKVHLDIHGSFKQIYSLQFDDSIIFIKILEGRSFIVGTKGISRSLYNVDSVTMAVEHAYKTYKEKLKLITFYKPNYFIIVSEEDKLLLYEKSTSSAKKTFKISSSKLVDVCMPSHKSLFAATDSGDVKLIKTDFENLTLSMEGCIKVDSKILSLDIFYYNEKLFLIFTQNTKGLEVLIGNSHTKRIMNRISVPSNLPSTFCTITVPKKPAEIYLLAFTKEKILCCDVDEKKMERELQISKNRELKFNNQLGSCNKQIMILGKNTSGLSAIGLTQNGLVSFLIK